MVGSEIFYLTLNRMFNGLHQGNYWLNSQEDQFKTRKLSSHDTMLLKMKMPIGILGYTRHTEIEN